MNITKYGKEGLIILKKQFKIFILTLLILGVTACSALAQQLDYSDKTNWAYLETDVDKPVDVFLICPTVDFATVPGNVDTTDPHLRESFVGALNMERGIYDGNGRMFAPFYQQANSWYSLS